MSGGLIAGGLGAALAAVAELLIFTVPDRVDATGRGLRVVAAAFVGGEAALGLVIVMLTLTIGGTVDPAIGLVSAALLGLGSFGIAFAYRGYAGRSGEVTPRERVGTILHMSLAQGLGILGAVLTLLLLFVSPA